MTAGRLPSLLFDTLPGEGVRARVLRFVQATVATARDVSEALGIRMDSACDALSKLVAYGKLACQRVWVARRRISVRVYWLAAGVVL